MAEHHIQYAQWSQQQQLQVQYPLGAAVYNDLGDNATLP